MDGNRFDALTRALGSGRSRRSIVKTLGAAALGAVGLGRLGEADAAFHCHKPNTTCGRDPNWICVNKNTDIHNCGACGHACPAPTGGWATCSRGQCGMACPSGLTACDGVCVDEQTDVKNCGACSHACDSTHGTPSCSGGVCHIACDAGYMNCDGNVANGCEIDIETDPANCGGCGQACGGGQSCLSGACTTFGCGASSQCESQCPQSGNQYCYCGTSMAGDPTCYEADNGCPGPYCLTDADCGDGSVCVNLNDGCGGCDALSQGKGVCNRLCAG